MATIVLGVVVFIQSLLIVVLIKRMDEMDDMLEVLLSKAEEDVYSAPKG